MGALLAEFPGNVGAAQVAVNSVPAVTSSQGAGRYSPFIEYGIERGDTQMTTTISHKIANLAFAFALLLPGAMVILNQGALIVA